MVEFKKNIRYGFQAYELSVSEFQCTPEPDGERDYLCFARCADGSKISGILERELLVRWLLSELVQKQKLEAEIEKLKAEASLNTLPADAQWKELTPQQRLLVGETLCQAVFVMLESFTEEEIGRLPGYCKHVMPNFLRDFQRDAEWFQNTAARCGND